jgi:hypothetical protein
VYLIWGFPISDDIDHVIQTQIDPLVTDINLLSDEIVNIANSITIAKDNINGDIREIDELNDQLISAQSNEGYQNELSSILNEIEAKYNAAAMSISSDEIKV